MNPHTWRLRGRLLAGIVSAALLLVAFPPFDVRYAAWIALVPLLLALRGATARAGAFVGFAAGLVYFGALLYWLLPFGVVAWAPLVVAQALAWLAAGWFGAWASHRWAGRILGIPLVFVAMEIARERWPLGGFAWGLFGTTQHSGPPILPLARIGGVFLVGLCVVVVNACIAEAVAAGAGRWRWPRRAAAIAAAVALVAAPASIPLGLAKPNGRVIEVASLQVNVREGTFGAQRGRQLGDEGLRIVDAFVDRTTELASGPPDLVIWPENALDRDPTRDPKVIQRVYDAVRSVGRPMIVGAILDADDAHFRNSLLQFDAEGSIVRRYDKQHLVPFGEYVPWPSLRKVVRELDQVPFDAIPGDEPVVFDVNGTRVGGVICFESTFPEVVRAFVDDGAQILIVATNNASFGRSTAAAEHLAQTKMRAVELGRYVVHAAISGTSAIVAPDGRVLERAGLFRGATLRAILPAATGRTPYLKYGAAIETGIVVLAILTALGGGYGVLARRRERREDAAAREFEWGPDEHGAIAPEADEVPADGARPGDATGPPGVATATTGESEAT